MSDTQRLRRSHALTTFHSQMHMAHSKQLLTKCLREIKLKVTSADRRIKRDRWLCIPVKIPSRILQRLDWANRFFPPLIISERCANKDRHRIRPAYDGIEVRDNTFASNVRRKRELCNNRELAPVLE